MKKTLKDTSTELSKNLFPVVGIGASAGGLDAFKKLVQSIPAKSGMAYILVQHLHPEYDSALPEILQRETQIPVVEINDKVHVEPDYIYVIPSNKLLTASDGILQLSPRPDNKKSSLSIDIFFSSLAAVHQAHSIGVILSGTGSDGTSGLEDIKNHGGFTFAQDPETAGYSAMPQHAIDTGIIDFILAPEKITGKLKELQQSFEIAEPGQKQSAPDKLTEDGFKQILALLRMRVDVDFNFYKQTTIRRRIIRRMVILKLKNIQEYLHYLKNNVTELDLLFQDLLIQVTSFFRDADAFGILCKKILPEIIKNKVDDNTLRIWIPACATGQEAYSIAICLSEYLTEHMSNIKVKIFATDLSEKAIAKARSGIYSKAETEGVSEARLQQFFTRTDGHYQLKKTIRDMCVFAVHNFLKDPPFAKMNLISCRNALIYLEPFLQKKALTIFHYSLNQKGFLFLGKSETVGSASDIFSTFDKKNKFYIRKSSPGRFMNVVSERNESSFTNRNSFLTAAEEKTDDFQKNADEILLSKYTPAGVVVNDQYDIVQFRGSTGAFLEPSPGKASLNVMRMAREGLGFEIRNALQKAKSTSETFVRHNIPINKGKKLVTLEVIPLLNTIDLHYLILFSEDNTGGIRNAEEDENGHLLKDAKNTSKNKKDARDIRIAQFEKELDQARKDMLRITEEQEAANEELQSSNEELLSGSEELQSLNEELETSKEELQSTNEELITINQELYDSNDELDLSRKFSYLVISTLHEPLLVLGKDFVIKMANRSFYKNFKLTEEETLGKILFELQGNNWDIAGLRKELQKVRKEKGPMIEVEIEHTFPAIGPLNICCNIQMLHKEEAEPLILLALDDITGRRKGEAAIIAANDKLEQNAEMLNNLYMNSPAFMCTLQGPKHIYDLLNPAYQKLFGARQLLGKPIMEALPELKGQGFDKILEKVYKTGEIYVATEVVAWLAYDEDLIPEERYFNFSYQPIYDENKKITGILVFGYEGTEQVLAKRRAEANLKLILESIPQITIAANANGKITFFNQYALDYSGLTEKEATSKKGWKKIVHPDELGDVITKARHCLSKGEDFYKEIKLKRISDGKYKWHLMRATPIKDDKGDAITSWVGVATDIHEQKVKEQNKDEFISIASHEMKTPLTSAKGYLQLLEMMLDGNNTEAAFLAHKALNAVTRLNRLITELLEVNKIQYSKLNYNIATFDFNKMVDETIEDQQSVSSDYTIVKKGEIVPEITGDRERLQQVVINLLSNAIKYSPGKKKVEITIKQETGNLIFSVKDYGIGIAKDNLENVFKKYFRVEDQAMRFQGMGIGLYISNEIVKRHQGKMWVESEKDKGSTFYFSIPAGRN